MAGLNLALYYPSMQFHDINWLKDLIDSKLVNYVPLSVQKIGIAEHIDTGEVGRNNEY